MTHRENRLLLVFCIAFLVLLRTPSFFQPLWNMDEAETAVIADIILDGGIPYRDVVDHRPPLTYYVKALVFLFTGQNNLVAMRCALTLLMIAQLLLIYRIASHYISRSAALLSAFLFAFMTTTAFSPLDAFVFHTEWCVIPLTTLAAWLLLHSLAQRKHRGNFIVCGGLYGLACFAKQPAFFDMLGALAFLLFLSCSKNIRAVVPNTLSAAFFLLLGCLIPFTVVTAFFFFADALPDFIFYAWTYNTDYYMAAMTIPRRITGLLLGLKMACTPMNIGFLTVLGMLFTVLNVAASRNKGRDEQKRHILKLFFPFWAVSSCIGASLSGRVFGHYFIQIFPPFCILAGMAFEGMIAALGTLPLPRSFAHYKRRFGVAAIALFFIAIPGVLSLESLIPTIKRFGNPLRKTELEVASYINQNSTPEDRLFVWGFNPELYVLSDRMPASRFIYCTFITGLIPWVNKDPGIPTAHWAVPGTMDIMLRELRENRPKFLIDATPSNKGFFGKYPVKNFPRLQQLINSNYIPDSVAHDRNGRLHYRMYRLARPLPDTEHPGH